MLALTLCQLGFRCSSAAISITRHSFISLLGETSLRTNLIQRFFVAKRICACTIVVVRTILQLIETGSISSRSESSSCNVRVPSETNSTNQFNANGWLFFCVTFSLIMLQLIVIKRVLRKCVEKKHCFDIWYGFYSFCLFFSGLCTHSSKICWNESFLFDHCRKRVRKV